MARKTRIEVEGGLYHLITRGNSRRHICIHGKTTPPQKRFATKLSNPF